MREPSLELGALAAAAPTMVASASTTRPSFDRRRFLRGAVATSGGLLAAGPLAALFPRGAAASPPAGRWLAGDLHCHTVFSHDVWSGPGDDNTPRDEAYTYGHTPGQQIAIAERRGLDFLALTDHNRVRAIREPDFRSDRLVLVPGYEHSLAGAGSAHAGVFMPSVEALPDILRDTDGDPGFDGPGGTGRFLGAVHERGGVAVINHPFKGNPEDGEALAWGRDPAGSSGFDGVEVWNTMWLARHDTFPAHEPDNHLAVQWWERHFARARRAAVGASDNHWRALDPIAGVGQPTTWVYAGEARAADVIAGIRAGRTTVSWQPPAFGGPRLELTATESWSGATAMVGDAVRAEGALDVRVRVAGGAGHRLRLISSGRVVAEAAVTGLDETVTSTVVLPQDGWLRAELLLEERWLLTALTSAIVAAGRAPLSARREPTAGRPVSYDGTGDLPALPQVAAVLTAPAVRALPACRCR